MLAPGTSVAGTALAGAAIILVVAALATHGLAVLPSTDDFCNRLSATAEPLGEALRTMYLGWSGRVVTGTLLYAIFATLDLPQMRIAIVALVLLFAAVAFALARLVVPRDEGLRLPVAAFALAALTLGLYPLLDQVVFWPTGGIVYLVPLILLLAWLRSFRRLVVDADPGWGKAAGFAFGIVVGNAIELVLPIVLVHGAVLLVAHWRSVPPNLRSIAAWRLAGVMAGACVLVAAPGNFVRAGATPDSFNSDPVHLARAFESMLGEVLSTGAPLLVIAAAMGLSAAVAMVWSAMVWSNGFRSQGGKTRGRLAETVALVAGAIASLVPLLAAPAQFAPRNGLYLLVTLFVAVSLLSMPAIARRREGGVALAALALAGAVYVTGFMTGDVQAARALRVELADRDQRLRDAAAQGNREAVVPAIRRYPPVSVHWIELAADASRWDNRCMARYYGLDAVRVEPVQR